MRKALDIFMDFSAYCLDVTVLGTVAYWGIKAAKYVSEGQNFK